MNEKFSEVVIFITGAASGLGRGLTLKFCELGATVIATDLHSGEIPTPNNPTRGKIEAYPLDVTDQKAFEDLIKNTFERYGRIDYLFNNAGVGIAGEAHEFTPEQWNQVVSVNFRGVVHGIAATYPRMVGQGFGHIVNTASLAALVPFPTAVPYAATKSAVLGLTRSLRIEARQYGVTISAICPGFVQTAIYENALKVGTDTQKILSTIPLPIIPLDEAIEKILEGIKAKRELIIFPWYAHLMWWAARWCYPLVRIIGEVTLKNFKKNKAEAK